MKIAERIFTDINFNDAKIIFFKQKNETLFAEFYIGDLQNGYYDLKVKFDTKNSNLPSLGEIITSEIQKIDDKFYFMFILSNLQEFKIEFESIKNLELNEISEMEYFIK